MSETPQSPGEPSESVVMNPEAIGDPERTPVLRVGAALRAWLNPCQCGGVNGYHSDDCAEVTS